VRKTNIGLKMPNYLYGHRQDYEYPGNNKMQADALFYLRQLSFLLTSVSLAAMLSRVCGVK